MNKTIRRTALASLSAIGLLGTLAVAPAFAAGYSAPVAGSYVMRLVSPLPTANNSVNLTKDAKGSWDQYYGKGLKALAMYTDVKGEISLTFKYTTSAGNPVTNATVYLLSLIHI